MASKKLVDLLAGLGACKESKNWAGRRVISRRAWDACERADWLNWIALAVGVDDCLVWDADCVVGWRDPEARAKFFLRAASRRDAQLADRRAGIEFMPSGRDIRGDGWHWEERAATREEVAAVRKLSDADAVRELIPWELVEEAYRHYLGRVASYS